MAVPFSNTTLRVPHGFGNILEGLAREVLREQPSDIPTFAADYFAELLRKREETGFDPAQWAARLEDRFYNNHAFKDAAKRESWGSVNKNKHSQAESYEREENEITQPPQTSSSSLKTFDAPEDLKLQQMNEYENTLADESGQTDFYALPDSSYRGAAGVDVCAEESREIENTKEQTLAITDSSDKDRDKETGLHSTSLTFNHRLADIDVCRQELQPTFQEEKPTDAGRDMTRDSLTRVSETPKPGLVEFQDVPATLNEFILPSTDSSSHIKQDNAKEFSYLSTIEKTLVSTSKPVEQDVADNHSQSDVYFEEAVTEDGREEMNFTKPVEGARCIPDETSKSDKAPKREEELVVTKQESRGIFPTDEALSDSMSALENVSLEDSRNHAEIRGIVMEEVIDERGVDQNPDILEKSMQDIKNSDARQADPEDLFGSSSDEQMGSVIPNAPLEPSRPDTPIKESRLDVLVEPSRPDTPVEPSRPDTPVEPNRLETPVEPKRPDTPMEPSRPDTPMEPSRPDTPMEPSRLDTPMEPSRLETPVEPSRPDTPVEPSRPESPVEPSRPESPVEPSRPDTPMEPSRPESPIIPSKPESSVKPSRPDTPMEPSRPESPVEPSRPESSVNPSRPDTPMEPSRPDTPMEPSRPDTPVEESGPDVSLQRSRPDTSIEKSRPDTPVGAINPEVPLEPSIFDASKYEESMPDAPMEPRTPNDPVEHPTFQGVEVDDPVYTPHMNYITEDIHDHTPSQTALSEADDISESTEGNNDPNEAVLIKDNLSHTIPTHKSFYNPDGTEVITYKFTDSLEHSKETKPDTSDEEEPTPESRNKALDQTEESSQPQEEEDIMDIPLDDPEANKAAAKIQAGFRGHMTRKKLKPGDKPGEEVSSSGEALNGSQGDSGGSEGVETDEMPVPEQ